MLESEWAVAEATVIGTVEPAASLGSSEPGHVPDARKRPCLACLGWKRALWGWGKGRASMRGQERGLTKPRDHGQASCGDRRAASRSSSQAQVRAHTQALDRNTGEGRGAGPFPLCPSPRPPPFRWIRFPPCGIFSLPLQLGGECAHMKEETDLSLWLRNAPT